MPDVVLHVERLLGGAGEQDARGERVAGVGQRMDAGLARIRSSRARSRGRAASPRVAERKGHPTALVLVEPRGSRREGLILHSA